MKTSEIVSPDTRQKVVFISYDEQTQTWQNGILVDGAKLITIIQEIRNYIMNFKW